MYRFDVALLVPQASPVLVLRHIVVASGAHCEGKSKRMERARQSTYTLQQVLPFLICFDNVVKHNVIHTFAFR